MLWCLPALASVKQDRALFGASLDRGIFDWQGTIEAFPARNGSMNAFVSWFASLPLDELLRDATRELWVCIHQHARRYQAMRRAILWLRFAVMACAGFLVLAIVIANA
jgi:hypothetical protein